MTHTLRSALARAGLGAAILALAAAPAFAAADAAAGSGRPLSASLTGAAEVPGPGDTDAAGSASLRVNPGQGEVCYELKVTGLDSPTAAHIHKGSTTEAGPVVVALTAPANGSSKGCASVTKDLAQDLIQHPEAYYVNVHNAAFPNGGARGQLSK